MGRKPQISATIPAKVYEAIASRARAIEQSDSSFLSDIASWWYDRGCPEVNSEDTKAVFRAKDFWNLNPTETYNVSGDDAVEAIMEKFLVDPFKNTAEDTPSVVLYANHPTHWLQFRRFENIPKGLRMSFAAIPKKDQSKSEAEKALRTFEETLKVRTKISQLPPRQKRP